MILSKLKSFIKKALEKFNTGYIDKVKDNILGGEQFIAVDVGAAVGVQSWWFEVLRFGKIIAYEPNKSSAQNLKSMYKEYDYNVIEDALDSENSEKKIYLTNVPTGSSLLKPNMEYKYADLSYFYPWREETISTLSAENSLKNHGIKIHILIWTITLQNTIIYT